MKTFATKESPDDEDKEVYSSTTPFQRMAEPLEIGAAATNLASPDRSFMTASYVVADGGLAQP